MIGGRDGLTSLHRRDYNAYMERIWRKRDANRPRSPYAIDIAIKSFTTLRTQDGDDALKRVRSERHGAQVRWTSRPRTVREFACALRTVNESARSLRNRQKVSHSL